jgi:predicted O-methyltransferase YrrM
VSIAAYRPLCERLGLDTDALPYTPNWSAAPDFLELIVDHALANKPAVIVECGSGMTTLMLARCCALNGGGHLYSLENGADYADNTRAAVARYGLAQHSSIIHAPLRPYTLNGCDYQWYDVGQLSIDAVDMLVIDGPPGFIQKHSRYPALPLLRNRLADRCAIFMDDAARPDEQEIVEMWLAESPALAHEYIYTERGCSVLRQQAHEATPR